MPFFLVEVKRVWDQHRDTVPGVDATTHTAPTSARSTLNQSGPQTEAAVSTHPEASTNTDELISLCQSPVQ